MMASLSASAMKVRSGLRNLRGFCTCHKYTPVVFLYLSCFSTCLVQEEILNHRNGGGVLLYLEATFHCLARCCWIVIYPYERRRREESGIVPGKKTQKAIISFIHSRHSSTYYESINNES